MITLTDKEHAVALRAAQYCLAGLKTKTGDAAHSRNIAMLEQLVKTLEDNWSRNDNGAWRCLCPQWRRQEMVLCVKCGTAKPE